MVYSAITSLDGHVEDEECKFDWAAPDDEVLAFDFDGDAIRWLKETSGSDITIGGAELAGLAIRAGSVDEFHRFLALIVVGRGKRSLPDNVRTPLNLLGERRLGSGVVRLDYSVSV